MTDRRIVLLRGICAIIFGVLTLMWPGLSLLTLVLLYGVFALFDGGLAIGAAIMGGTPSPRWWLALVGVLGIGAGAITLMWPGITGIVLLYFIAGWAIAAGVFEIVGAIRLRKEIEGEWWLIATGSAQRLAQPHLQLLRPPGPLPSRRRLAGSTSARAAN